eukprot:TRINITY_DN10186_c0_g1_i1.p1 TRINITY_DN10186_c0_g1~~TRINITY_DN10186_c0_g1_i1.p1  ORF type:complete len:128 (-),score=11.03 TRINITY_DN10186_c0_g1_i1:103-486(-)
MGNIPLLVTYIVLEYYYEGESITKIHKDSKIDLDHKYQIATLKQIHFNNVQHTIHGSLLIDFNKPFIYDWDIRVLSMPQNMCGAMITIGIAHANNLNEICYGYSNYGTIKDRNTNCLIYAEEFKTMI